MKSRDEMVKNLLERRNQYEKARTERRRKTAVAIPVCCACIVALMGVGIWQNKTPDLIDNAITQSNTDTSSQSDDTPIISDKPVDMVACVNVNGANYVQCSNVTQIYTPDKYLGVASDFEGTFQLDPDVKLFTVTEDSDMLIVKLENGDYMFLAKEEK